MTTTLAIDESVLALTPELASERLARAGFGFLPEALRVEPREERWLVHLPDQRMAWFAASAEGRRRLHIERRVLRLLESRCTFRVPRILFEDAAGVFDLRAIVPGGADPWQLYTRVCQNPELARRLGALLGEMLVEQHSRIGAVDVASWLPAVPSWPRPRSWIIERLPRVIADGRLMLDADRVLRQYESVAVSEADRALVHADLGLHNLGDGDEATLRGVFDYEGAAWADRHHDFRYFVLDCASDELLHAARAVYEPAIGVTIQPERVYLYNAACALCFLAERVGKSSDEQSYGRTLAEDLRWCRQALARVLGARRKGA